MEKTNFKKVYDLFKSAKSAAIVGHIHPDGDCVGSCLALRMVLMNMGCKKADVLFDDEVPEVFSYISGFETVNSAWASAYDILVIVDTSSEDRLGKISELRKISKKVICIDHHVNTTVKADEMITNSTRGSVGEILYEFFDKYKLPITKDIATALYTSVSSDTGCFLFPNTTKYTHFVAGELIEKGIDVENINYFNFRVYEREIIPIIRIVLKSIKICGNIAIVSLPYKIVKKYNVSDNHKFKRYASDISGVKISAFISEERKGLYHVSLRSHGGSDVSKVAAHFGGGGHKNASGFNIKGKRKAIINQILTELKKVN